MRAGGPHDLVLANILARPLCLMARPLAAHLAPGGTAILAGLLAGQARQVLAAHRRHGLVLEAAITEGPWTTLVLRKGRGRMPRPASAHCPPVTSIVTPVTKSASDDARKQITFA